MQIEQRKLVELQPYPNNPRKNDHAVESVARAIDTFGFNVPILIKSDGSIIDGHLRYKAASYLQLDSVPVLVADHLSEEQVNAFRISVNKLTELAKWDMSLLEQELLALNENDFDLSLIGFSEAELDVMLNGKMPTKDRDNLPEFEPPVVNDGELWLLGDHRLFIGDSTKKESYERLLQGEQADLVWTDPPYNVDYSGKAGKIKNDKMSEEEFFAFLFSFYQQVINCLKPGGPIYVAHADGHPSAAFRQMFIKAGFYYSTCLIWKKSHSTLGRADYHYQHEPILYGWKPGVAHCWYGGRKRKSIIELGDQSLFTLLAGGGYSIVVNNEELIVTGKDLQVESVVPSVMSFDKPLQSDLHPTMKPVALVEHCLINSSCFGDVVVDSFGGSGTTLIACEDRKRKARIIEMDTKFADVIIRRWQEYTVLLAIDECGKTYNSRKNN